jgi:hypothetical protein
MKPTTTRDPLVFSFELAAMKMKMVRTIRCRLFPHLRPQIAAQSFHWRNISSHTNINSFNAPTTRTQLLSLQSQIVAGRGLHTESNHEGTESNFKGVVFDEQTGTWQSVIEANGKEIKGGSFMTEEEAAKSYDVLAQIFHGDDADTNFEKKKLASWTPHDDSDNVQSRMPDRIPIRHRCTV